MQASCCQPASTILPKFNASCSWPLRAGMLTWSCYVQILKYYICSLHYRTLAASHMIACSALCLEKLVRCVKWVLCICLNVCSGGHLCIPLYVHFLLLLLLKWTVIFVLFISYITGRLTWHSSNNPGNYICWDNKTDNRRLVIKQKRPIWQKLGVCKGKTKVHIIFQVEKQQITTEAATLRAYATPPAVAMR